MWAVNSLVEEEGREGERNETHETIHCTVF